MSELFTRDGHLHDLAIDRVLTEDLSPGLQGELDAHLAQCPPCVARLEEARAFVAEPLPVLRARPAPGAKVIAFPGRMVAVTALVGAFAMAAAFLLSVKPPEPGETFTPRGGDLELEIHRQTPGGTEQLHDGDAVRAGDHLGFRVMSREPGYLMVVGVDQSGGAYACYPSDPDAGAVPVQASGAPVDLNAAIQLDESTGRERIAAVRCKEPFGFGDLSKALSMAPREGALPNLRPGCAQVSLSLPKPGGGP